VDGGLGAALRDDQVRATASSSTGVGADLLASSRQGHRRGVFHCPDPAAASFRLASLMDGLRCRSRCATPTCQRRALIQLWRDAARLELGIVEQKTSVVGV